MNGDAIDLLFSTLCPVPFHYANMYFGALHKGHSISNQHIYVSFLETILCMSSGYYLVYYISLHDTGTFNKLHSNHFFCPPSSSQTSF